MITFINNNLEEPFKLLKQKYEEANNLKQKNVEAISVSSFSTENKEVDSRFVNLKIVDNDEFIFFSNYNSPKSKQFDSHKQISAILFWPVLDTQIRIKAIISRTSHQYNQKYFFNRSIEKNALAISSNQSRVVDSYSEIKNAYNNVLNNKDTQECPQYWGGFKFKPYSMEFWEGHKNRLNKRLLFSLKDGAWLKSILQP
ncbi:pyridoxal 5'-phosphate synthase [Gammaproteobacteria bacterium]|nr:pyridoxal 5'-phosphate synthase [Gammaproteobacteria bacterium]